MGNLARRLGHSSGTMDSAQRPHELDDDVSRTVLLGAKGKGGEDPCQSHAAPLCSGRKGDYLSTMDNTTELSDILGTKYPSHFYKEIEVCSSCFKVYKLIDEARDRAMDKLHAKMDEKREKAHGSKVLALLWCKRGVCRISPIVLQITSSMDRALHHFQMRRRRGSLERRLRWHA